MDETLRFIIGASLFVAVVFFEWINRKADGRINNINPAKLIR